MSSQFELGLLEYVLNAVIGGLIDASHQNTYSDTKDSLSENDNESDTENKHETHCIVKIRVDFNCGEPYRTEWVLPNDFYEWLCETSPSVNFGKVSPRYSDHHMTFKYAVDEVVRDYFKVESYIGEHIPLALKNEYAEWEESLGRKECVYCGEPTDKMQLLIVNSVGAKGCGDIVCSKCAREESMDTKHWTVEPLPNDKHVDHTKCADTLDTNEACVVCLLIWQRHLHKDEKSGDVDKKEPPKKRMRREYT